MRPHMTRSILGWFYEGITDVICLMGFYTIVSMTLAFYDVPAGATRMARCEIIAQRAQHGGGVRPHPSARFRLHGKLAALLGC